MSISTRIRELLDIEGAVYQHHRHPVTFTAKKTADSVQIPEGEMLKTLIVNADGLLRMAVIPANCVLDLKHMKFLMRSENIRMATEKELNDAFPDCEIGAMPPFGSLFGLPVYCDVRLANNDFVEFNAGTHIDTIRMAFEEFKRVASPIMTDIVDHYPSRAA
jgi:Ala-tRNA(Pro) deacylase